MSLRRIAVLAKDPSVLKFLDSFFRKRKIFKANVYSEVVSFLREMSGPAPNVVLSELPFVPHIFDKTTKVPVIALIKGGHRKGIEKAVAYNVKNYVCSPFVDADLEYKIESAILEKDFILRTSQERKELEAIIDITKVISDSLDPKEILFRIVRKISELIPVTRCSIISVDWLRKSAYVIASFEDPNTGGIRLSLRKYPEIVAALTSKQPVVIRDIETDPIMKKVKDIISPLGIKSILVMPIFFNDRVIGTLFLRTSRKKHMFKESEIALLNAVAAASSKALHNAFLFERVEDEKTRLEKLAITDYLTGIYNIRYFYHRIIEEFSRCQRYEAPISCLMLDIDFFKKINDTYGHKIGDHVLKEFAQLLKKYCRKSDVLARYGGEEFIILLPQTGVSGAVAEAERLRACVKAYSFRSLRKKSGITVSVGVSAFPDDTISTHDDLIAQADNALFLAKTGGRDRVAVNRH